MRNLLDFLTKHSHWILFAVLELISVVLLFQYNSYQGSVWVTSANAMTGKIYEWDSAVESFFSLTKVNESLTLRNFYLERQVSQLSRLYAESTGDTVAAKREDMATLNRYRLTPAKVIGSTLDRDDNLITIDKGRADGIAADMGVACGLGVVGVVYMTSEHYSIVLPVLNVRSRISCTIRKRGYFGYLRWSGGDPTIAYVEDIPRHAHFKLGDWVETNGYSSIFPQGVPVGKILQVYNSRDGLSYRLKIQLATDFGRLRDVYVISDRTIAERSRLMEAARDSLQGKTRK
ncbi:MAG: rod shape-determining protein MreC [Prevotella sp.]|nr:rod shape-determining protein MreC [Prevotella sp.]